MEFIFSYLIPISFLIPCYIKQMLEVRFSWAFKDLDIKTVIRRLKHLEALEKRSLVFL